MSQWGWSPARNLGIWRYGAGWLRPALASIPYVTVGLLLLMMYFVSGTMTSANGVLFDLPAGSFAEGGKADLVALVMPVAHDTAVFYDDARYLTGEPGAMRNFGSSLASGASRSRNKSLLILADRRISTGILMELVSVARASGIKHVLVAGRRTGEGEQ